MYSSGFPLPSLPMAPHSSSLLVCILLHPGALVNIADNIRSRMGLPRRCGSQPTKPYAYRTLPAGWGYHLPLSSQEHCDAAHR